jgi:exoribonuclease II
MASQRNISFFKGDSYYHEVRIKNESNTAINISGRTYNAKARVAPTSDKVVVVFQTEITDAANGVLRFSLLSNQTSVLMPGTYFYDLEEINGEIVTTLMNGQMLVMADVTYV